jgi:hypothetical protein
VAELVANCPRCKSKQITFDLRADIHTATRYGWQFIWEAFCVCRHCSRATTFVLLQDKAEAKESVRSGLAKLAGSINRFVRVDGYISLKDEAAAEPPEHLPDDIRAAFIEGAKCQAIGCFNAAATMYRLCVDMASRALLPQGTVAGLSDHVRRTLKPRLDWLFANALLPRTLEDLSHCIREDGNDGAHAGTLSLQDAEDLYDFTFQLLERLYTEPKKLELAKLRRDARRKPQNP